MRGPLKGGSPKEDIDLMENTVKIRGEFGKKYFFGSKHRVKRHERKAGSGNKGFATYCYVFFNKIF